MDIKILEKLIYSFGIHFEKCFSISILCNYVKYEETVVYEMVENVVHFTNRLIT